jgi:ABC-type phosphate transport system auxiliary subunit
MAQLMAEFIQHLVAENSRLEARRKQQEEQANKNLARGERSWQ